MADDKPKSELSGEADVHRDAYSEKEKATAMFDNAAHRVRNAVLPDGGRKEGAATYIPQAAVMTPVVLGGLVKTLYDKSKE